LVKKPHYIGLHFMLMSEENKELPIDTLALRKGAQVLQAINHELRKEIIELLAITTFRRWLCKGQNYYL
jgi:hypothetical protein